MDDLKKQKMAELRYRARTDLYYMATEILGYDDLVPEVHQVVCDHFYQMKPGTPIADVSTEKGMSLYDPRGHFKTTIAIASAIQWLITYPNIRVFIGAGKIDRASDTLGVIKQHFLSNAKLRRLFPEFCPPPNSDWGTTTEFTLPNRTKFLVDPSCYAFSLTSIKAGPHCDVVFLDDAVHPDNLSVDQMQETKDKFVFLRSIVEPYGYTHVIGTPYSDSDLYAWLEEPENGDWLRKFRRPAWIITNPTYDDRKPLTEADVTLLFPQKYPFSFLNSIRKQNEFIFNCQYLLDPSPVDQATFTERLLRTHIIPHAHIPRDGAVFTAWDLNQGNSRENKRADYAAGATGLYDSRGNLFILDIVMDKFNPAMLGQQIAAAAVKWRPRRIGIEDAAGAKLLAPFLELLQRQMRRNFNIEYVKTNPTRTKSDRILSLQPLLVQNTLYFSANIPTKIMDEVIKMFVKFPRYAHDDGPDAISQLLQYRNRVDIMDTEHGQDDDQIDSVSWDEGDPDSYLLGAGIVG